MSCRCCFESTPCGCWCPQRVLFLARGERDFHARKVYHLTAKSPVTLAQKVRSTYEIRREPGLPRAFPLVSRIWPGSDCQEKVVSNLSPAFEETAQKKIPNLPPEPGFGEQGNEGRALEPEREQRPRSASCGTVTDTIPVSKPTPFLCVLGNWSPRLTREVGAGVVHDARKVEPLTR